MRERAAAIVKGTLLSLPAFFLGAAPFFYFYAVDPYSSLSNLGGGYALSQVPEGLYLLFVERLPQYLDWELFELTVPFTAVLAAVVYGWATLFFLWKLRRSFRADDPFGRAAVFPIFFLVFVLLFAASIHIRRAAPQYVLPLSAFFPVALGFWLVHSPGSWKPAAWAGCTVLFLLHGWTGVSWVASNAPQAEAISRSLLHTISGLEAKGVKRLYVPTLFGSELFNFYARERIIASQMTAERYPPNLALLEKDPEPAFLYPRGADNLPRTPAVLGASSETATVVFHDVIRPMRGPDRRYRQVPAASLRASASHESRAMQLVVDRDMDTLWTSTELKQPGMWVELDVGRPLMIGMVRLWNWGEHHGNYAMDLRVETSMDGVVWRGVVKRSATDYFYWSGPRVYGWECGYRWEARFPPVEARFVKITQFEDDHRSPW